MKISAANGWKKVLELRNPIRTFLVLTTAISLFLSITIRDIFFVQKINLNFRILNDLHIFQTLFNISLMKSKYAKFNQIFPKYNFCVHLQNNERIIRSF